MDKAGLFEKLRAYNSVKMPWSTISPMDFMKRSKKYNTR